MPRGSDEIQACMNAHVALFSTLRLLFLPHIDLMLVIHEINDRRPRVAVVHIISKTGSINYSQLYFEGLLLQFGFDNVHLVASRQKRVERIEDSDNLPR